jgi:hypothetical protein
MYEAVPGRTALVFEPVRRGPVVFPFPFGHWAIRDSEGEIHEGVFQTPKHLFGEPFGCVRRHRILHPEAIVFPLPKFRLAAPPESGVYSDEYNCVTIARHLVGDRTAVGWLILVFVDVFTRLALAPPAVAKRILEAFDVDSHLYQEVYHLLGFAAGDLRLPLVVEDPPDLQGIVAEALEVESLLVEAELLDATTARELTSAVVVAYADETSEAHVVVRDDFSYSVSWLTVTRSVLSNAYGAIDGHFLRGFNVAFTAWADVFGHALGAIWWMAGQVAESVVQRVGQSRFDRVKTAWGLSWLSTQVRLDPKAKIALSVAFF